MGRLTGRLKREHQTLVCMTRIYCSDHHGSHNGQLCNICDELMAYSELMRYAGPRMPLRHPIQALTHVFDKLRRVVHPMELRRARKPKT
jgi:hypothetical protein